MPQFRITSPNGEKYNVTAPDGATEADVVGVAQKHFALAASDRKDMERMADPTTGMSTIDKGLAGAGKFVSGLGTGASQIGAQVMDKISPSSKTLSNLVTGKDPSREAALQAEEAETRKRDAPLMATTAAKVGNFIAPLATVMIPGAGTLAGAALTGGALGALQPTVEGEGRIANTLIGGVAGTAGQAVGQEVGAAITSKLAQRIAERSAAQAANAGRDATVTAAREAGYVVPPTQTSPTLLNRALEGAAGKASTAQEASAKNQAVTNRLTALGLGRKHDERITPEILAEIRKDAGKAYEKVAEGSYVTDVTYKNRLRELSKAHATLAADVPELANKDVLALVKSLGRDKFEGKTLVEVNKALRERATAAYKNGETEAGRFYKGAAHEIENLIERNLLGSGGKETLAAFKEARQRIAKSYAAEAALNPATGNINAQTFAAALRKGKPITGEMRQVAEFAGQFPKATQLPERMGSLPGVSPLDYGVAAMRGDAGGLAWLTGRPAVRAAILSKIFQNSSMKPSYSAPAAERLLGQAVEGNRLPAAMRAALPDLAVNSRN